jgi:hypothetical protein
MIAQKSPTHQYIGEVTKSSAATAIDLPEGSLAIVDEAGTVQSSALTGTPTKKVRIAQKVDGILAYSPTFSLSTITSKQLVSYVAPVEQVTYLGYNGTVAASALDAKANTTYNLAVWLSHTAPSHSSTPTIKSVPYTNVSGTQAELAKGLLTSFDRVFSKMPNKPIRAERISNGSFADWSGAATHVKVVNGTTGVIYTNGSGVAANGEALAAGTIVFITGATYVVAALGTVDGFTIDAPYKGASAEVAGGATYATNAGIATTVTNWGLKFTGISQTNTSFDPIMDMSMQVRFELTFNESSVSDVTTTTAPITYATEALEGRGTYKEVSVREIQTQFGEKDPVVCAYPPTKYRMVATKASTYNYIVIEAFNNEYVAATTGQQPVSKFTIYLVAKSTLGNVDGNSTVLAVS